MHLSPLTALHIALVAKWNSANDALSGSWPYVDGPGPLALLDARLCRPRSVGKLTALELVMAGNAGDLFLLALRGPAAVGRIVPVTPGAAALTAEVTGVRQFTLPEQGPRRRILLELESLEIDVGDCVAWWYASEGGPRIPYRRRGRRQVLWQLGADLDATTTLQFNAGEARVYAARLLTADGRSAKVSVVTPRTPLPLTFSAFLSTQPTSAVGHQVVARESVDTAHGIAFIDMTTCGTRHRGFIQRARLYSLNNKSWGSLRLQVYRRRGGAAAAVGGEEWELRGQSRELLGEGSGEVSLDLTEDLLWLHGPLDCIGWRHEASGTIAFESVTSGNRVGNRASMVVWRRGAPVPVGTVVQFSDGAAHRVYSIAVDVGLVPLKATASREGEITAEVEGADMPTGKDASTDVGVPDSLPEECRHSPGEHCCSAASAVGDSGHVFCVESAVLQAQGNPSLSTICKHMSADYGLPLRPLYSPYDRCRVALSVPPLRAAHHAGPQPRRVFVLTFATNLRAARPLLDSAAEHRVSVNVRGAFALCSPLASDPENCLMHMYRSVDIFTLSLHPLDLLLRIDAYDIQFVNSISPIISGFLSSGYELLFSAEKYCAPDPSLASDFPDVDTPYRFLNGGVFLAYAFAVERLHRAIEESFGDVTRCNRYSSGDTGGELEMKTEPTDEDYIYSHQRCYQWYYLTHYREQRIGLDNKQQLAACLTGLAASDFEWLPDGTLLHKVTGAQPSMLHANEEGGMTMEKVLQPLLASRPFTILDGGASTPVAERYESTGLTFFRPSADRRRSSKDSSAADGVNNGHKSA